MRLPHRSPLEALYEIVTATTRGAEPALAKLGLTMPTVYVLWAIDPDEPPPTMKTISERIDSTKSNLTFTTERLVELGYLTRTEDPSNRRFRVLSLTPKGRKARKAALDALNAACPLRKLSSRQLDQLFAILGPTLED
ncbi:winged helix DNA-binding protein [Kibdelosporangium philippinense]|uniref:Winged helix DNA-binding protein n=1 Tax=Kibdelosporangium philippinense TaxID=211113 RepID=A0ABS8Z9H0_9PSEU|nr:MarR family transcriptional regulator [Kibdelosporangium philippinense]MCE7003759.1 winged helix DNA-binding protein [Kibdelosporangium philippinense]